MSSAATETTATIATCAGLGESIAAAYSRVRGRSVDLVAPLSPEDCLVQSMPDASPAKWHLAHTTWFFEQFVLQPGAPGYRVFDARFAYLFNSYYEAVGPRHARPERGLHHATELRRRRDVGPGLREVLESHDRGVHLRRRMEEPGRQTRHGLDLEEQPEQYTQ